MTYFKNKKTKTEMEIIQSGKARAFRVELEGEWEWAAAESRRSSVLECDGYLHTPRLFQFLLFLTFIFILLLSPSSQPLLPLLEAPSFILTCHQTAPSLLFF